MPSEYITTTEARRILGVSTKKIAAMIAEGTLESFPSVLDKRVKLVKRADVERLAQTARAAKKTTARAA